MRPLKRRHRRIRFGPRPVWWLRRHGDGKP